MKNFCCHHLENGAKYGKYYKHVVLSMCAAPYSVRISRILVDASGCNCIRYRHYCPQTKWRALEDKTGPIIIHFRIIGLPTRILTCVRVFVWEWALSYVLPLPPLCPSRNVQLLRQPSPRRPPQPTPTFFSPVIFTIPTSIGKRFAKRERKMKPRKFPKKARWDCPVAYFRPNTSAGVV